ncbi:O-antigen ligase family protein [Nocardioides humi]|uniref:O-antigen ligase-related domain-containing protein n=1 Tax=Nocardioides humi TaxID=449461 RepID=A0ABN2ARM2_9ACTN|nr:O-antigen ligase family protein [Nocardioides humi]
MSQLLVDARPRPPAVPGFAPVGPGTSRWAALGVAAVMVVLPFGDVGVPVLGMSLVYVAMALPALLALGALARDEAVLPASGVLLGLGLCAAGGVVSTAVGVRPPDGVTLVVISFLTLGYAVGVSFAYRPGLERDGPDLLVLVGGVVAVMTLVSAGSLEAAEGGSVINGRLTGPFAQPNELGIFCAALLPIAVACLVTTPSRRRLAVLGIATACLAMAWAMSMSRGAWIGGIAALVCLAIAEPRTRRALAGIGAAVVATCAAALVLPTSTAVLGALGARLRSLQDPSQNQYDDRPLIWAEAWRQATTHPWFGVGPGGYPVAAGDSTSAISSYGAQHPHDLLLTVLAERGAIGLGFGAVVVAGCVIAARRHALAGPAVDVGGSLLRTRSMAVIAALVAVAVHCVFDMPLRNPIVAGLVWTLLGMAVVAETARSDGRPS